MPCSVRDAEQLMLNDNSWHNASGFRATGNVRVMKVHPASGYTGLTGLKIGEGGARPA